MKYPKLPNFDGLIGLASDSAVDIRPTLVRVMTDLYVQKSTHTRDEEHRYTELALWLLSAVDIPTRVAVANKLAAYDSAPRPVVRRLARDVLEVAEPILQRSPCLTSSELIGIIKDLGPTYASIIAGRHVTTADTSQPQVSVTASQNQNIDGRLAAHLPSAASSTESQSDVQGLAPMRPRGDIEIGDMFLNASTPERRILLAELEHALGSGDGIQSLEPDEGIGLLETAASEQRIEDFARGLEQLLQLPAATAQRIAADLSGEPIIVAAKALGMPPDTLLRILLLLNPEIGQSVHRVFDLVNLYREVPPEVALTLTRSWRGGATVERRSGRYQPTAWVEPAGRARRISPEARPQPGRVDERATPARIQRTT